MPKIRLPRLPLKLLLSKARPRLPVLTGAEKSALGILLALLAAGAALRAWERSGVSLGPVDDWDSLRELVIRAPKPGIAYACAEAPPAFGDEAPRGGFVKTGARKSARGGKKTGPARPVDLNAATEAQLNSLPGVGPSTAKAILAYRATTGKFLTTEDLMNVKGIGPRKFEALRKFVRVAGVPPPRATERVEAVDSSIRPSP
jgi:competence protein ComEA